MAARFMLAGAAMRPSITATSQVLLRRSMAVTRPMALKENASHDPNPEVTEKHKQDSLSKQKDGKGHWKPELASVSEESVKADRAAAEGGGNTSIKDLQDRTKAAAEETSKAGTSMRDGL